MKKIIGLSIAALLIIAIVGVGTFAYFSDTAASTGNTWTAGTLTLGLVTTGAATNATASVSPAGSINNSMQFTNVVPGSSGTITWTLNNTGNVPGTLTLVASNSFTENPAPNPSQSAAWIALGSHVGLGQELMVWVTRNGTPILGTSLAPVPMSDLAVLTTGLNIESQSLVAGTPLVYVLNWTIPGDTTGNEIQGDKAQLDINFTLTQTH